MAEYKIIEKWYIGTSVRSGYNSSPYLLGFMVPDGDDSSAKKRKATVDKWRDNNSVSITDSMSSATGFKLLSLVNRGSRDSNQDKWKILDPRGYVFEITSSNLLHIMNNSVIDNMEIKEECSWIRDGANNRLLVSNSSAYKELVEDTKKLKSITSKNGKKPTIDLVIGTTYYSSTHGEMEYIGKYYTASSEFSSYTLYPFAHVKSTSEMYNESDFTLINDSKTKSHLFISKYMNNIVKFNSAPKISRIVNSSTTLSQNAQNVIKNSNGRCEYFDGSPCIFSEEKIKINDNIEEKTISNFIDDAKNYRFNNSFMVEIDNKNDTTTFLKFNRKSISKMTSDVISSEIPCGLTLKNFTGDLTKKYTGSCDRGSSYYYGSYTKLRISNYIKNTNTSIKIHNISFDVVIDGVTKTIYMEIMQK